MDRIARVFKRDDVTRNPYLERDAWTTVDPYIKTDAWVTLDQARSNRLSARAAAGLPAPVNTGQRNADGVAQGVATAPLSNIFFNAQLMQWKNAAPAGEEKGRRQAVKKILKVMKNGEKSLHLNYMGLTSLPNLPAGLTMLFVGHNQLTGLPDLPTELRYLWAAENKLTSLPDLPAGLTCLIVIGNQLTSLPALPAELTELSASGNQLTSLPALPAGLKELSVPHNQLTSLPTLPAGLTMLCAKNNRLNSLPAMPPGLGNIRVDYILSYPLTFWPAHKIRQWQSDHPHLVDQSGVADNTQSPALPQVPDDLRDIQPPAVVPKVPGIDPGASSSVGSSTQYGSCELAIGEDVVLSISESERAEALLLQQLHEKNPRISDRGGSAAAPDLPRHTEAQPQFALTGEQYNQVIEFLTIKPQEQASTLTPEQRDALNMIREIRAEHVDQLKAIPSLRERVAATTAEQAELGRLLPMIPALDLLTDLYKSGELSQPIANRQHNSELEALRQRFHSVKTADDGANVYTWLKATLVSSYTDMAYEQSSVLGKDSGMQSRPGAIVKLISSGLAAFPHGGAVAAVAKGGVQFVDQNRIASKLLLAMEELVSVDGATSDTEKRNNIQNIAHGVAYRMALHYCSKPAKTTGAHASAVKSAVGMDNRSIASYQRYGQRILAAILEGTQIDRSNIDEAINSMVVVALTPSQVLQNKRARSMLKNGVPDRDLDSVAKLAELYRTTHEAIISEIKSKAAATVSTPTTTGNVRVATSTGASASGAGAGAAGASGSATTATGNVASSFKRSFSITVPSRYYDMLEPADGEATPISQELLEEKYTSTDLHTVRSVSLELDARVRSKQTEKLAQQSDKRAQQAEKQAKEATQLAQDEKAKNQVLTAQLQSLQKQTENTAEQIQKHEDKLFISTLTDLQKEVENVKNLLNKANANIEVTGIRIEETDARINEANNELLASKQKMLQQIDEATNGMQENAKALLAAKRELVRVEAQANAGLNALRSDQSQLARRPDVGQLRTEVKKISERFELEFGKAQYIGNALMQLTDFRKIENSKQMLEALGNLAVIFTELQKETAAQFYRLSEDIARVDTNVETVGMQLKYGRITRHRGR